MKFGMQAVLTAQSGKGDELAEIMKSAADAVAKVDGCELYLVQHSIADENQILITELWSSAEHHKASLQNPEVIALITRAKPIIAAMEGNPAKLVHFHSNM